MQLKLADDKQVPLVTHCAQLWCFITNFGKFDLILGMPWLEQYDPRISFRTRTLTFDSDYCIAHCLLHGKNSAVPSCSFKKIREVSSSNMDNHRTGSSSTPKRRYDIAEILASAFTAMAQKTDHKVTALWPRDLKNLRYKMKIWRIKYIEASFAKLPQILQQLHRKTAMSSWVKSGKSHTPETS